LPYKASAERTAPNELVGPTGPDNVSDWIETLQRLESIEEGTEMAKEPTTKVA